ncbi:MAG: hypothetical protein GY771_11085 [bacterium]|nr:hypothetical protein [bacterium]
MVETIIGYGTLIVFVVVLALTLFRKINLPIQTVLILITLFNVVVAVFWRFFADGFAGVALVPNEVMSGIILHPITALLAGLFIAGALSASGGFDALKVIIEWLKKTPIGLPGTMVLLMMLPLIVSLPCGRIMGAAMLPLLFAFGPDEMKIISKGQLIILVGAFARNAFGSCGPSPIGGVGQIGEGFLGSFFATAADGILRAPQSFALFAGTAFMALFLMYVTRKIYPNDTSLTDAKDEGEAKKAKPVKARWEGYFSLIVFAGALLVSIFQPFGKMPVQTVLIAACVLIMVVGRVRIVDLMAGIILMPVTAMAAGFLAAGSLAVTGGFDALGEVLKGLADINVAGLAILGIAGMLAFFVQIQTIMPLSCSRILTAALVPVLFFFGPAKYNMVSWTGLAIVMSAYMINATSSCAPSPLGGAGMMAEGTLRSETGYLKGAFSFTAMAVMAPLAAIFMRFLDMDIFMNGFGVDFMALLIGTVIIVVFNFVLIKLINASMGSKLNGAWSVQFAVFLVAGIFAGAALTFALAENGIVWGHLVQGGLGGGIAALLIALMTPRAMNPLTKEQQKAIEDGANLNTLETAVK